MTENDGIQEAAEGLVQAMGMIELKQQSTLLRAAQEKVARDMMKENASRSETIASQLNELFVDPIGNKERIQVLVKELDTLIPKG